MISKPKFKICRRLGPGVYDKCQTSKFKAASGKAGLPGARRPTALSEYGTQLVEKQKILFSYGITERQLSNYVKKAILSKGTGTAEKFYEELESRLDNVVYKMGLGKTRRAARQMVSHGHIMVGGSRVGIPSYEVKVGEIVSIRPGSVGKPLFKTLDEKMKEVKIPEWLSYDAEKKEAKVTGVPKYEPRDNHFDIKTVLEFYSR